MKIVFIFNIHVFRPCEFQLLHVNEGMSVQIMIGLLTQLQQKNPIIIKFTQRFVFTDCKMQILKWVDYKF